LLNVLLFQDLRVLQASRELSDNQGSQELLGRSGRRVPQGSPDFKDSKGLPAVRGQLDFQEVLEIPDPWAFEALWAAQECRVFPETRDSLDSRDFQDREETQELQATLVGPELLDQAVISRFSIFHH